MQAKSQLLDVDNDDMPLFVNLIGVAKLAKRDLYKFEDVYKFQIKEHKFHTELSKLKHNKHTNRIYTAAKLKEDCLKSEAFLTAMRSAIQLLEPALYDMQNAGKIAI